MRGLHLKPLQSVGPELSGVARKEDGAARLCDSNGLFEKFRLVDRKSRNAILNAKSDVENSVAEAQANCIHSCQPYRSGCAKVNPRHEQAFVRSVHARYGFHLAFQSIDNPSVAAAHFKNDMLSRDLSENERNLGLEIPFCSRGRQIITGLETISRQTLTVIVRQGPPSFRHS